MNAPTRTSQPTRTNQGAKRADLTGTVSFLLTAMRHWRIALLMAVLAGMLGISYYVYARSVYFSKSLVKFTILDLPVNEQTATRPVSPFVLQRSMLAQLRSRHLVERTAKRLGLVDATGTYGIIRDEFVQSVRVEMLDEGTLAVDVSPYYPDLARDWTEAMVEEFRDYRYEVRDGFRDAALAKYTKELKDIEGQIHKARENIFQVEKDTDIVELGNEYERLQSDVRDLFLVQDRLDAAKDALESISAPGLTSLDKLSRLTNYNNEVRMKNRPGIKRKLPGVSPVVITPLKFDEKVIVLDELPSGFERWSEIESEVNRIKSQLDKDSLRFGAEHKVIIDLKAELAEQEERIETEARAAINRFTSEIQALEVKRDQLADTLGHFQEVTEKYSRAREIYEMAVRGQLPWDRAHAKVSGQIEGIIHATEKERIQLQYMGNEILREDPVSPSKMKLVYLSVTLALFLGLGVPFALEYLNNTVSRIDEVENAFGIPGLGIVPESDKNELENIARSPEIDATSPNSLMENFRVIRGGIAMNKDMDSQVVLITSAKPSEGKTSMTCNLGWAFASVGAKTLIIDSDLRRGRVHDVLGVSNEVGLSDVLMGRATLEESIRPTEMPGLSVITRGGIYPGSTEKLCTIQHEQYVDTLRQHFDHILMDCPPVLGLSESSALTRLVDGVVFTIRAEYTSQRDVGTAIDILQRGGAKFFGFVLNRLDLSRLANYHKYFYYSSFYYDELVDASKGGGREMDPARLDG